MDKKLQTEQTVAVAPASQTTVADTGAKSYIAIMTLAFFAGPLGLARAYRGDKSGWTRFWIFVGSYIGGFLLFWTIVLPFLAGLAIATMAIWGIVDFFLLYKVRTDAAGKPLQLTPRDEKWAKGLLIAYVVGLGLAVVGFVVAVGLGLFLGPKAQQYMNPSGTYNGPVLEQRLEDSLRRLNERGYSN